jgi:hypothetical protein
MWKTTQCPTMCGEEVHNVESLESLSFSPSIHTLPFIKRGYCIFTAV